MIPANHHEDDNFLDEEWDEEHEPPCHTCGGDGWVDSVSQESGRTFWDTDGPGPCPNCNGSGLRKDCVTF